MKSGETRLDAIGLNVLMDLETGGRIMNRINNLVQAATTSLGEGVAQLRGAIEHGLTGLGLPTTGPSAAIHPLLPDAGMPDIEGQPVEDALPVPAPNRLANLRSSLFAEHGTPEGPIPARIAAKHFDLFEPTVTLNWVNQDFAQPDPVFQGGLSRGDSTNPDQTIFSLKHLGGTEQSITSNHPLYAQFREFGISASTSGFTYSAAGQNTYRSANTTWGH